MARFKVKSIGFCFFVIHMILAVITLILSLVQGVGPNLLATSLVALFVNILWAVFQTRPSCRWSGLEFGAEGNPEPHRRFVPRWAVTMCLAFFYFIIGVSAADVYRRFRTRYLDNDVLSVHASSAFFCLAATFAYVVEFFIGFIRPNQFDGL